MSAETPDFERLWCEAYGIRSRSKGATDPLVLDIVNNLALAYGVRADNARQRGSANIAFGGAGASEQEAEVEAARAESRRHRETSIRLLEMAVD